MKIDNSILSTSEIITLGLRTLYSRYGYTQYKMSKFEEYDLYSKNKDFLVSDSVITFTDTSGKLMALKPDVTLSIIKNTEDETEGVRKLSYNENVYRVSKKTDGFKEIMQVGIECIGDIDIYNIGEVLSLASKSLESINDSYILDISDLDILSGCIKRISSRKDDQKKILSLVSEKNTHELLKLFSSIGKSESDYAPLLELMEISDKPSIALPRIKTIARTTGTYGAYRSLKNSIKGLDDEKTRIDFSLILDTSYYNGIVFRGFIEGIPEPVLSGGQYDPLLEKMRRKSKAIGFAVYIDLLEDEIEEESYDIDILALYDDESSIDRKISSLRNSGLKVYASRTMNTKVRYKELLDLRKKGEDK